MAKKQITKLRSMRFDNMKDAQRAVDKISGAHNDLVQDIQGNPFIDGAQAVITPEANLTVTIDNPLGRKIQGCIPLGDHPVRAAAVQPSNTSLCKLEIQPWRWWRTLTSADTDDANNDAITFDADGELATEFRFSMFLHNTSGSTREYKLYPNSIVIGATDGDGQRVSASGTAVAATIEDVFTFGRYGFPIGMFELWFFAEVRGALSKRLTCVGGTAHATTPGATTRHYHSVWNDQTTKVTSIQFNASGSNAFQSLTQIECYEKIPTVPLKVWLY